jgi:hypothetical protein
MAVLEKEPGEGGSRSLDSIRTFFASPTAPTIHWSEIERMGSERQGEPASALDECLSIIQSETWLRQVDQLTWGAAWMGWDRSRFKAELAARGMSFTGSKIVFEGINDSKRQDGRLRRPDLEGGESPEA